MDHYPLTDSASKEKSFTFAMMHLRTMVSAADEEMQKQVLLEAITSGAVQVACELSKHMRDSWFLQLVKDKESAKSTFCNWDLSHLAISIGMQRLPSISCAYIKHVMAPLPRPIVSIAMLHQSLEHLISTWHTSGARLDDNQIRGTPLMVLLRWMFHTGPQQYMESSSDRREAMQERFRVVHPKKQMVACLMTSQKEDTAHDSPWSLQLAPTLAIVRRADDVKLPEVGHGRTSAVHCSPVGPPAYVQARINHLEFEGSNRSPASIANQVAIQPFGSNSIVHHRVVPMVQLLSHGTRDARVVKAVHDRLKSLQREVGGNQDAAIGFDDASSVVELRRSFADLANHGVFLRCSNINRMVDLAIYWWQHLWDRYWVSDVAFDGKQHDTFDCYRLGSGCTRSDLLGVLIHVWTYHGVVKDGPSTDRMKTFLLAKMSSSKQVTANANNVRIMTLCRILEFGLDDGNSALAQVALDALATHDLNSWIEIMGMMKKEFYPGVLPPEDFERRVLCTCVHKCPGMFKSVLGLHVQWSNQTKVQALCMGIFRDIPDAVSLLLDELPDGSMPKSVPRYLKSHFEKEAEEIEMGDLLPWLMEGYPAYLTSVLEKGGEWCTKDFEELLRQCDPNKADTIAVAEWLMMPPRSLKPLPDKPWLQWLNDRLYAPGGPGYAMIASRHLDMDGSEHDAKLGANDASPSVPIKRSRTH